MFYGNCRPAVLLFIGLLVTGCGDPIGHECELRSGALGFGFDDDCKSKCLQLHRVTCPDLTVVQKSVCAGAPDCEPGSCGTGEMCYSFEDPTEKYFYCIPSDFCGDTLNVQGVRAWETTSRKRSNEMRAEFSRRMERRTSQTLTPVPIANATPTQKPEIIKDEQVQAQQGTSVLIESWGFDMAPVICVSNNVVETGSNCIQYLPSGTVVEHGGSRVRSTGLKQLECPAMRSIAGVGGEPLGSSVTSNERWSWVPAAPERFRPVMLQPLDPLLLAVAMKVIPDISGQTRIELAATADFDGNGALERVLRVFTPSSDPDKPGHTTLWIADETRLYPLSTEALELNGIQIVRGVLPLDTGGALLVFTSNWTGGSAVHVIGPGNGRLETVAEVACGT